jgi:hypothetical protein
MTTWMKFGVRIAVVAFALVAHSLIGAARTLQSTLGTGGGAKFTVDAVEPSVGPPARNTSPCSTARTPK